MDPAAQSSSRATTLLPIMGVIWAAFLVIGLAMPVLPLHVHDRLGLGTFLVGLVTGSQFAASLFTRPWAGRYADRRGGKRAVVVGLLGATVAGCLYLLSLPFVDRPGISVAILLLGRAVLGAAESVIITGGVCWGMALAGATNTGKAIAWIGAAMFAAFAVGAPAGSALYGGFGFVAIAGATALAPALTLLLVARLPRVPPSAAVRPSFVGVIASVWIPGLGAALGSVGFGAITAFVVLWFAQRGWANGWLAYTGFATAFILARVLLADLTDRVGGARVALVSVLIEAVGLALLWRASRVDLALLGAALTGLGYSLVYPGLGVEAVRRLPSHGRGLAMGAYTACLDIALGFGTPALGLIASRAGLGAVFLASAVACVGAAAIAAQLLYADQAGEPDRSVNRGAS